MLDEVAGPGMTGMAMDVRNEQEIIDTVAASVAARGPIQICVANAGIAEGKAVHKTSLDFWRNMMATNLDGAFLTIRECLQSMRGTDWGRVITMSSIAAIRSGTEGWDECGSSRSSWRYPLRTLFCIECHKKDTRALRLKPALAR